LLTHNLTCSENLLKVSSISGLTGPKTVTPLLRDPVLPIPEDVALQFIDVRESSSMHFLLQNTRNTIPIVNWIYFGGVRWPQIRCVSLYRTNYRASFRHDIVELCQQNV